MMADSKNSAIDDLMAIISEEQGEVLKKTVEYELIAKKFSTLIESRPDLNARLKEGKSFFILISPMNQKKSYQAIQIMFLFRQARIGIWVHF